MPPGPMAHPRAAWSRGASSCCLVPRRILVPPGPMAHPRAAWSHSTLLRLPGPTAPCSCSSARARANVALLTDKQQNSTVVLRRLAQPRSSALDVRRSRRSTPVEFCCSSVSRAMISGTLTNTVPGVGNDIVARGRGEQRHCRVPAWRGATSPSGGPFRRRLCRRGRSSTR
eukprot:134931-Chlamydomonas_euryale.AAC.2